MGSGRKRTGKTTTNKGKRLSTSSVNPFAVKKAAKRTRTKGQKKSCVESVDKDFSAILSQGLAHKSSSGEELVAKVVVPVPEVTTISELSMKDVIERTQRTEIS